MSTSLEAVGRAVQFSGLGKEVRDRSIGFGSRSATVVTSRVESSRVESLFYVERLDAERLSWHAARLQI